MTKENNMKSIFGRLGSSYEAVALTFPQIDVEKVKQKLRLKEEAVNKAKADLPSAKAAFFDDVEQKIVSFIDNELKAAIQSYYDHMRSFEDRINRLQASGHVGMIETITIKAESDFETVVKRDATRLHTTKTAVTSSEKDLEKFKQDNDLQRSARYTESQFLYYAVAMLLITIETGINGYFFAKGHEMGMLGGGFTAFIPALLNVLTGYYLGNFACRLAIHKKIVKRCAGIFLCALLPLWIFTLNLLIAHYRTAMTGMLENDTIDAAKLAIDTFIADPFGLHDVDSWLLMITGCTFALIATLDFWKMDDPYPHFGEITRDHDRKLLLYSQYKEDSLNELADLLDENLENLEEASNLLNAKVNEANLVVDSQSRWKVLFSHHLDHLEDSGRQMLAYYRNQNMAARKEKSAPEYFNEQWSLTRPVLPETGMDFAVALSGFQSEANAMRQAYSSCVARIGESYKNSLEKYQTIEQLKPEELKEWLQEDAQSDQEKDLSIAA